MGDSLPVVQHTLTSQDVDLLVFDVSRMLTSEFIESLRRAILWVVKVLGQPDLTMMADNLQPVNLRLPILRTLRNNELANFSVDSDVNRRSVQSICKVNFFFRHGLCKERRIGPRFELVRQLSWLVRMILQPGDVVRVHTKMSTALDHNFKISLRRVLIDVRAALHVLASIHHHINDSTALDASFRLLAHVHCFDFIKLIHLVRSHPVQDTMERFTRRSNSLGHTHSAEEVNLVV